LFQPLGQQNLGQRLIGSIALVRQDFHTVGSAGPALQPCGSSSGAGCCRAANKIIRILVSRAAKTTARWKSRPDRSARYFFSLLPPNAISPPCFSPPIQQTSD
jgi:hypothetical protein